MGPSRPDKSRTAARLGLVTSSPLAPQNLKHTIAMGFGKFLGLSSSSGSTSRSPQSRGIDGPQLGPGSSKADYAYGLNQSGPSTSSGLAAGYYNYQDDAPPAYYPQDGSDLHDWSTDHKMSTPEKTQTSMVNFSAPDDTWRPQNSAGEFPLRALSKYDIVLVLDDSYSMMIADNTIKKTRWDQVSNCPLARFARIHYRDQK